MAALIINTFGSSVLRPTITSQITKIVPRDQQGAVLGVTQSLQSFAQIVAPLIGGYMIGEGSLTGWAWTCSFISFSGIFLMIYQKRAANKFIMKAL